MLIFPVLPCWPHICYRSSIVLCWYFQCCAVGHTDATVHLLFYVDISSAALLATQMLPFISRGDMYKQLEWVILDAHANLLDILSANQSGNEKLIVQRCERLSALIVHSTIPHNEQLLTMQEKVGFCIVHTTSTVKSSIICTVLYYKIQFHDFPKMNIFMRSKLVDTSMDFIWGLIFLLFPIFSPHPWNQCPMNSNYSTVHVHLYKTCVYS